MSSAEQEALIIRRGLPWWRLLLRDKFALVAALWLLVLTACFLFGPDLFGKAAIGLNLRARNLPPGLRDMWGAVLVMLSCASPISFRASHRFLLAVVVLYILEPSVVNLIIVLAITRLPIYLRVTRAEVLEIRERVFVDAARALGSSRYHILRRHIAPVVAPTLLTILTVDFSIVMLAESRLSFLGIGMQPPEITWGLMVAQGRNYLSQAWWLAFFPGLAIMMATLSGNILSNWLRIVTDPEQRWRLEAPRKSDD
jgi:peptide/nickel transport system permease protein